MVTLRPGWSARSSGLGYVCSRSWPCLRVSTGMHLLAEGRQSLGGRSESTFVPVKLGAFLSVTGVFFFSLCLTFFFFFFSVLHSCPSFLLSIFSPLRILTMHCLRACFLHLCSGPQLVISKPYYYLLLLLLSLLLKSRPLCQNFQDQGGI